MTAPLFELLWQGGAAEDRLRKRRPGADLLPWGSLDLAKRDPVRVEEARKVWTSGVFTEYASAAAFASLSTALLECGAPIDLTAACADIVVDELFHVELSSRLTAELGGAVALQFDLAKVSPLASHGARPLMRAAEIALTTSCVGEALSVPALARARSMADEPLVRAVLGRLLADEPQHARLGFLVLDWLADELIETERDTLAAIAMGAIEAYAPLWLAPACDTCPSPIGLGGHDMNGREALRAAVTASIAMPLAEYGIVLDSNRLAAVAG